MNLTDAELMRRVQGGDHDAFGVIAERYQHRVKTYIQRLVRSDDRAEDLTQQTFLWLYENASRPGGDYGRFDSIEHLLMRVAVHITTDDIRREERRARTHDGFAILRLTEAPSAGANMDAEEIMQQVSAAMAKLPPIYRVPAILHFLGEHTYAEVARLTGSTTCAVRTRISRARAFLIGELKDYWKGAKDEL